MPAKNASQYVLLPARGVQAASLFTKDLRVGLSQEALVKFNVIDEIRENGAKLVELEPDAVTMFRAHRPGMRLVPLVHYRTAVAPRQALAQATRKSPAGTALTLRVVSAGDGAPIADATVVAFTDFESRAGAQGKSSKTGAVKLALGGKTKKVERIYVYPGSGYWSLLRKNVTVKNGDTLELVTLAPGYADALRLFYGNGPDGAGAGVTVGVLDTGIDRDHPDLRVDGGVNTVQGEDPKDYGDNGAHHGSHVAGIIAARGKPPTGARGVAPDVRLRAYRVFGKDAEGASNYAIAKAIDRAVDDGCDLLNMSLGGGPIDEATRAAIEDARSRGTVIVAAAGNDGREPVNFPASDSLAIAVSAMGRVGTFPPATTEAETVMSPRGSDSKNYIASFSNVGPEIDLTGPGVGIVSTVPGGYASMSGTSMACPAVTGMVARMLAGRADLLGMARNQERSDAIVKFVLQAAATMGFGPTFEGAGMLPR